MFEFPSFAMHDMGIKRRVVTLGCNNNNNNNNNNNFIASIAHDT